MDVGLMLWFSSPEFHIVPIPGGGDFHGSPAWRLAVPFDDTGSRGVERLPVEKVYERCFLLAQSMGGVAMVEVKEIHPKG